jgi:hypothetical protein
VIRKLLIEKGEHGGGGADGRHEPPKIKHEEESPRVGAPVNPAPGPKGARLSVAIYQRRADAPAYFQFKVVASDAPSNAHDVTRENERMSALVLLDATPPELAALAAEEGSLHCLATNAVSRLVAVTPLPLSQRQGHCVRVLEKQFPINQQCRPQPYASRARVGNAMRKGPSQSN